MVSRIGLPYIWVFLNISSFSGFRVVCGVFISLLKCQGLWLLLIVTNSFSLVVTYIIVCCSCRPCFKFWTYFHSVPVDLSTCLQNLVPVVHFELSAMQWRLYCAQFGSYVSWLHSYNDKKKYKLMGELKSMYSCFWNGRGKWEVECFVFKLETYVCLLNKSALDLRAHMECKKHKTTVRGEMSLAKGIRFCTALGSKSDYAILAAECALSFHSVKCHSSYMRDSTFVLFKMVFLILK